MLRTKGHGRTTTGSRGLEQLNVAGQRRKPGGQERWAELRHGVYSATETLAGLNQRPSPRSRDRVLNCFGRLKKDSVTHRGKDNHEETNGL